MITAVGISGLSHLSSLLTTHTTRSLGLSPSSNFYGYAASFFLFLDPISHPSPVPEALFLCSVNSQAAISKIPHILGLLSDAPSSFPSHNLAVPWKRYTPTPGRLRGSCFPPHSLNHRAYRWGGCPYCFSLPHPVHCPSFPLLQNSELCITQKQTVPSTPSHSGRIWVPGSITFESTWIQYPRR